MKSSRTKSFVLTALPAIGAFLVLQACGGGGDATAQATTADPLEGVWESVITGRDCTTSAVTVPFSAPRFFTVAAR